MSFRAGEKVWVVPNRTQAGEPGYYGTVIAAHIAASGRFVFSIQPHDTPGVQRLASLHHLRGIPKHEENES